ncbi:unnamed protein product [Parnassius mnemosyne]|uniref:Uncharacterized protein n=1 Tax=Parnassius mnemosyne TaxID=213953 RepID=A0AAV1LNC8_9NEOP
MFLRGQSGRAVSLNRFDPKYASFGPRAPRPRPAAPAPPLATFSPAPAPNPATTATPNANGSFTPAADKYATVRPSRRTEPQPLSAAALEYRSLQRPRRQQQPNTGTQHRRRPDRQHHDQRDLYAVTEL